MYGSGIVLGGTIAEADLVGRLPKFAEPCPSFNWLILTLRLKKVIDDPKGQERSGEHFGPCSSALIITGQLAYSSSKENSGFSTAYRTYYLKN